MKYFLSCAWLILTGKFKNKIKTCFNLFYKLRLKLFIFINVSVLDITMSVSFEIPKTVYLKFFS